MNEKDVIGYLFTGIAHIHGVPAIDLDIFEYEKYEEKIKAAEKASGLVIYQPIFAEVEEEKGEE